MYRVLVLYHCRIIPVHIKQRLYAVVCIMQLKMQTLKEEL